MNAKTEDPAKTPAPSTDPGEEMLATLGDPIVHEVEAAGLTLGGWIKRLVALADHTERRTIKVKGGARKKRKGYRVVVKGGEEDIIETVADDAQVQLAALRELGIVTGWRPADKSHVAIDPLTLIYTAPASGDVQVIPDDTAGHGGKT